MITPRPSVQGVYYMLGEQDRRMVDFWRAVIAQAIRDMDLAGRRTRNEETIRTELDALTWIGTEDYHQCCLCALIDGDELAERLREIILLKPPYRRLLLRDLAEMVRDPPPRPIEEEGVLDAGLAEEPDVSPKG